MRVTADDEITVEGGVLDAGPAREGPGWDSAGARASGHAGNKAALCEGCCGLRCAGGSGFHPPLDLPLLRIQRPPSLPPCSSRPGVGGGAAPRHQAPTVPQLLAGSLRPSGREGWSPLRPLGGGVEVAICTCLWCSPRVRTCPQGCLWGSTHSRSSGRTETIACSLRELCERSVSDKGALLGPGARTSARELQEARSPAAELQSPRSRDPQSAPSAALLAPHPPPPPPPVGRVRFRPEACLPPRLQAGSPWPTGHLHLRVRKLPAADVPRHPALPISAGVETVSRGAGRGLCGQNDRTAALAPLVPPGHLGLVPSQPLAHQWRLATFLCTCRVDVTVSRTGQPLTELAPSGRSPPPGNP